MLPIAKKHFQKFIFQELKSIFHLIRTIWTHRNFIIVLLSLNLMCIHYISIQSYTAYCIVFSVFFCLHLKIVFKSCDFLFQFFVFYIDCITISCLTILFSFKLPHLVKICQLTFFQQFKYN